jgi:DivIVA domain-containing protein
MPLTPQQIRDKVFTATRFRAGYSEQEVDDFLEEIERELGRLMAENSELRRQLEQRGETPVVTGRPAPEASEVAEPVEVQAPPAPASAAAGGAAAAATGAGVAAGEADLPPDTEAEQLLRRTLVLAQRTAEEAIREARSDAEKLRADAQAHFEQQIGQVEHDRHELEQQIDQLRSFEREYRTRLRAYLELQLRELDSPGSTQGQVEGAPSRPPIGAGAAPAGSGPGGPAGTAPGGPAGPDASSPFSSPSPADSAGEPAAQAADDSPHDSGHGDGEGEGPTTAPSTPSEG